MSNSNTGSKLEDITAEVFELFFAVDQTLRTCVANNDKCVTVPEFVSRVAEHVGLTDDEIAKHDTLIRFYLQRVDGYVVERGRYGGVRRLRDGESKVKARELANNE